MKTAKGIVLALTGLLAAALFIGAKDGGNDRPSHIDSNRWIKFSDNAGLALTEELSTTRHLAGHLYIRTDKGWRAASLLNPATAQLLEQRSSSQR